MDYRGYVYHSQEVMGGNHRYRRSDHPFPFWAPKTGWAPVEYLAEHIWRSVQLDRIRYETFQKVSSR